MRSISFDFCIFHLLAWTAGKNGTKKEKREEYLSLSLSAARVESLSLFSAFTSSHFGNVQPRRDDAFFFFDLFVRPTPILREREEVNTFARK
jgi:hypothetical protein